MHQFADLRELLLELFDPVFGFLNLLSRAEQFLMRALCIVPDQPGVLHDVVQQVT